MFLKTILNKTVKYKSFVFIKCSIGSTTRKCPTIEIKVVPWARGKNQLTESYSWFLANWARRMSWQEVSECFRTTWHHVFNSVKMAVEWGRERVDLSNISALTSIVNDCFGLEKIAK